jgi:hypothetical protein
MKRKTKRKPRIRKPVPKKASRPISTKKGDKGYDRKKLKKILVKELIDERD